MYGAVTGFTSTGQPLHSRELIPKQVPSVSVMLEPTFPQLLPDCLHQIRKDGRPTSEPHPNHIHTTCEPHPSRINTTSEKIGKPLMSTLLTSTFALRSGGFPFGEFKLKWSLVASSREGFSVTSCEKGTRGPFESLKGITKGTRGTPRY